MKILSKSIILACFLCFFVGNAQDLNRRIPASADAVISLNGSELFSIFPEDKFNKTQFGKEIIKELERDLPGFSGIQDFGIDLHSTAHFYYQQEEEIPYFSFLFSIADYEKFSSFFAELSELEGVTSWNGATIFSEREVTMIYDKNRLQICIAEVPYAYVDKHKEALEKKHPGLENYALRSAVSEAMVSAKAKENFTSASSILTNNSYKASVDKNAAASGWVKNYGSLLDAYYGIVFGNEMNFGEPFDMPKMSRMGFGTMAMHLYFKEDELLFKSSMAFGDTMKKTLKQIYKQKMDKSFYQYANLDQALAYMSYSISTENMFKEYPFMLADIYGKMMPGYEEEMDIAGDLLETILDEEAIGELLTGNALFVVDDISEKEVSYVTYEYDEEYNEKKVTKTKRELMPDFTLLIGTERMDLAVKLAKLGVKYEALTGSGSRYKLNPTSDIPFEMFMLIKDDLIVMSTSEKNLNSSGTNTSRAVQKIISKNAMYWHVDVQGIMNKIPTDELGMNSKEEAMITNNFKSATLKSSKIKGNTITSELSIQSPNTGKNALQLLMDQFEEMMK